MDEAGQVFHSVYAYSEAIADQLARDWAEGAYTAVISRRRYSVFLHHRTVTADDVGD